MGVAQVTRFDRVRIVDKLTDLLASEGVEGRLLAERAFDLIVEDMEAERQRRRSISQQAWDRQRAEKQRVQSVSAVLHAVVDHIRDTIHRDDLNEVEKVARVGILVESVCTVR